MEELNIDSTSNSNLNQFLELKEILKHIQPWSEDLYESEYFFEKRWLEVDDSSNAKILHIFRTDGEYLESVNGNILTGSWSILENSNTMILERPSKSGIVEKELYDLAFLNDDFFILKKHGAIHRYLVMGKDQLVSDLNLEEVLSLIESRFQRNRSSLKTIFVIAIIIALYLVFRATN